jgi:hypothetical protein
MGKEKIRMEFLFAIPLSEGGKAKILTSLTRDYVNRCKENSAAQL